MSTAQRLPALVIALSLVAAGCASAAQPSLPPSTSPPPSAPSEAPSLPPSPDPQAIDHPTGSTDVVLRYDEGGGLAFLEGSLASVPIFTLYGDGTVIFRNPNEQKPADETGLLVYPTLKTARLSDEQMQALLAFAVTEGGLAAARDRYDNPILADAGSATFTINAGGRTKQVTVAGLLESDPTAPDQLSRSQFLALAERLRDFDGDGDIATADYQPTSWRVHLLDAAGTQPASVHEWPWPDLAPSDFSAGSAPDAPTFPHRTMGAEEVAALGQGDLAGGLTGYYVEAPDGSLYSVVIRPMLPDDED